MSMYLTGQFLGLKTDERRRKDGTTFEAKSAVVLNTDSFATERISLSRDFDESLLPAPGEMVGLEVSVTAYLSQGGPRVSKRAWAVVDVSAVPVGVSGAVADSTY